MKKLLLTLSILSSFYFVACDSVEPVVDDPKDTPISNLSFQVDTTYLDAANSRFVAKGSVKNNGSSKVTSPWYVECQFYTNLSKTTDNRVVVGDNGTILKSIYDIVSVENIFDSPTVFSLNQNYPNPFNPNTKINWQSPEGSWQTLKVYDVLGNEVSTLVDEYKPAKSYEVEWDASKYPSGVYSNQLKTENSLETRKMILMK